MGKNISITAELELYNHLSGLGNDQAIALCLEARKALHLAYAPYSNYQVGVAIRLKNGDVIIGNNQENAVYPLGLCAERVAIYSSTSQNPDVPIIEIAVTTHKVLKEGELPPFPCGSCRQVMLEKEARFGQSIKLYIVGANDSVCVVDGIQQLLPFCFDANSL